MNRFSVRCGSGLVAAPLHRRKYGKKEWDAPPDAPGNPNGLERNRTGTDSVLTTEPVFGFGGSQEKETYMAHL